MATTSAGLGRAAVLALADLGIPMALLQADRLPDGGEQVSDIDLVVGVPPSTILSLAGAAWAASGLHPIISWPYDVGGTTTVFLATADAGEGVQLDMLHDPEGRGRYGIRSRAALELSTGGPDVPVLPDAARVVYRWRKKVGKGDLSALPGLREDARSVPEPDLRAAAMALTGSPTVADEILDDARAPRPARRGMTRSRLERSLARLRSPVGFWAHVPDRVVAEGIASRLSRFLGHVGAGPLPAAPTRGVWYLRRVAPIRYRPGVFISHGPGRPRGADARLDGDLDTATRRLVAAMNGRLQR